MGKLLARNSADPLIRGVRGALDKELIIDHGAL